MTLTTIADLIFAGGVVLAALALAGAALRRAPTSALASVAALEAAAAVGVWVAFALRHDRPLAVSAACYLAFLLFETFAIALDRLSPIKIRGLLEEHPERARILAGPGEVEITRTTTKVLVQILLLTFVRWRQDNAY